MSLMALHEVRDEAALEGAVTRAIEAILGTGTPWSLFLLDRSRVGALTWRSAHPELRRTSFTLDGGPVAAALSGAPAACVLDTQAARIGEVDCEIGATLPLDFRGRTYAALVVHRGVPSAAWPKLVDLGRHLGVALANQQRQHGVLSAYEHARARLEALERASELMTLLELEPLLVKLLELALELSGSEVGCLLRERDEDAVEWGLPAPFVSSLTADGESVLARVLAGSNPFLTQDMSMDARLDDAEDLPPSGLVLVPIPGRESAQGCLAVGYPPGEVPSDQTGALAGLAKVVGVAIEALQAQADRREQERATELLAVASRHQEQLLGKPSVHQEGLTVAVRAQSCEEAGGDVHLVTERPDGTLLVAVGDVVGHGVAATLQMASVLAAIRALAPVIPAPDQLLEHLQAPLAPVLGQDRFLTLFLAVFDPEEGLLTYASAGHDPAWLRDSDGTLHQLEATGLPLGILEDMPYAARTLPMGQGSVLVAGTDGLWEAVGHTGARLGTEALRRHITVGKQAEDVAEALWSHVQGHLAGRQATDDRTLVVVRRDAVQRLSRDHGELASLRQQVQRALREASWKLDIVEEGLFLVALTEAAANVQEHGMQTDEGHFEVEVDGAMLRVRLSYEGQVFDPNAASEDPDPWSEGGRGLPLMDAGADEVRYFSPKPGWAAVELVKRRPLAVAR